MNNQSRKICVLVVAATAWFGTPCRGQVIVTPPLLFDAIESYKAELLRGQWQNEVVRLAEQRREEAKLEISAAAQEQDRTLQVVNAKDWAAQSFEDMQTRSVPTLSQPPKFLRDWYRAREVQREKFVRFPELSKGEIKSGKALNFFLDACGSTAVQHDIYLTKARTENVASIENLKQAVLIPGSVEPAASADQRLAIINALGDDDLYQFRVDDVSCIHVTLGLLGPKVPMRVNDDPLNLEWPAAISQARGDCYRLLLTKIELLKKRCLEELRNAPKNAKTRYGIPLELQRDLTQTVDRLIAEFDADTEELAAGTRQPFTVVTLAMPPEDRRQRAVAMRFLNDLRNGVARLIEARRSSDIGIAPFPPSGVAQVGIRDILVYMSRQGLRFAEADINDERTYERLYQGFRKYYTDLHALALNAEADWQYIEFQGEEMRRFKDIQFEPIEFGSANEGYIRTARTAYSYFDYRVPRVWADWTTHHHLPPPRLPSRLAVLH